MAASLTEVLVVMLIITILMAIMIPILVRAKDRAKDVVCTSNMRQIYMAMKLYESDFGMYPPNSVVWPAFRTYYPVTLRCPKAPRQLAEFDYQMVGSPSPKMPKERFEALEECMRVRAGEYPLVQDHNHVVPYNADLPQSVVFFLRENGAFSVVPFNKRLTIKGPCNAELLSPDINL